MISERTNISAKSPSLERSKWLGLPQVWVRFLLALAGLVLAFGAALFSTVTRESGSVWGTVFLASVALLLSAFVGLTTVPYLARRVVASRVREAIDYDVTRAGLIYILISVVIGIAASGAGICVSRLVFGVARGFGLLGLAGLLVLAVTRHVGSNLTIISTPR